MTSFERAVIEKPYSYTYGADRAYHSEIEAGGLPVAFWRETVGFCRRRDENTSQEEKRYTEEYAAEQTIVWTRAVARYTNRLVFVGVLAAVVSAFQWWEIHTGSTDTHALADAAGKQAGAAQEQLQQMKLNLQRTDETIAALRSQNADFIATQRAFVNKAAGNLAFISTIYRGTKFWSITPIWENSGNTHTVDLRVETHCVRLLRKNSDPEIEIINPEKMIAGNRIIGPHQVIIGTQCNMHPEEIEAIDGVNSFGFIWLRAKYKDIFQGDHITEWCGVFDEVHGDDTKLMFNSTPCAAHNCADEQCKADK